MYRVFCHATMKHFLKQQVRRENAPAESGALWSYRQRSGYSTALTIASITFLASPNTIIVFGW